MPRKRSLDIAIRNQEIFRRVSSGERLQAVADDYGLSKQMISKIFHGHYDKVGDDATRDVLRAGLEESWLSLSRYERELNNDQGGKRVIAANGKPVYELIENPSDPSRPFWDFTRPVYEKGDVIRIAEAKARLAQQIARLYGLERLQQRQPDQAREIAEALAWVEQLAADKKALAGERDRLQATVTGKLAELEAAGHSHGYDDAEDAEIVTTLDTVTAVD